QGYKARGVSEGEAERRAWATVNKDDGGGKKSGSGRGKDTGNPAAHKGGEKGGKAAASRSAAERSASPRKAAANRRRNAEQHAHYEWAETRTTLIVSPSKEGTPHCRRCIPPRAPGGAPRACDPRAGCIGLNRIWISSDQGRRHRRVTLWPCC